MDGGGGGMRHLMLSVCIDVRPARLVESAAAPSEPMPFDLRESTERAEESKERTGRRGRWMLLYNYDHHERAREGMGRRGEGGHLPPTTTSPHKHGSPADSPAGHSGGKVLRILRPADTNRPILWRQAADTLGAGSRLIERTASYGRERRERREGGVHTYGRRRNR
jgi:hypothetical protein